MIKHLQEINDHTKHVIDWTSIGIVLGSLIQVLPSIAAALSIVWTLIRIYETKTVQRWLGKGK
jgi:hypothetical protein